MTIGTTAIAACIACTAGLANAALIPATPVSLSSQSSVSVEFISQSAGATGSLYFLGWQPSSGPISWAGNSDGNSLGQHLFSNHGTSAGTSVSLGQFNPGTLHFAYLVTSGVSVAPTGSLFRTDLPDDQIYFAADSIVNGSLTATTVGIEDIRKPSKSDWDYNDLIVQVNAAAVPAPGAAALAIASAGLVSTRRRRTSP